MTQIQDLFKKEEFLNFEISSDEDHFIKNPMISIIIPLFNEEHSIRNVIAKIPNHYFHEIIVVDDGSTDNSVKKVREINNIKIRLIQHKKNKGYGAAILTGIKYAKGNVIVTMDSDGQHNPDEIPRLINPILKNQADFVVGSRYLGKCNYKVPLHTRMGELFVEKMLLMIFRQKVKNNQGGFRAFNRKTLKIFNNMIHAKFGLCTEMLLKAACNNLRIREVPISLNSRAFGTSYVKLIRVLISIIFCILLFLLKKMKVEKIIPKQLLRFSIISIKQFLRNY